VPVSPPVAIALLTNHSYLIFSHPPRDGGIGKTLNGHWLWFLEIIVDETITRFAHEDPMLFVQGKGDCNNISW
jgi:hypothetical protein